jgi:hypothetical protein
MGLDYRRSASDVWLSKTGRVEDADENDAMMAGTLLEPAVLDWAERQLYRKIHRDQFLHGRTGCRCANLDGIILDTGPGEIVEAKTTGIVGPRDPKYGEPGTDDLPERVLVQVHHQFSVVGPECCIAWVPVLIGGEGFRMYRVERDEEIVAKVVDAAESFWNRYVVRDIRPDDFKPQLETLKRMRRVPGLVRRVPDELADQLIVRRAARLQAEKDEAEAARALLTEMGDAEAAEWGEDGKLITYMEYKRAGYTVKPGTFRKWGFPKHKAAAPQVVAAV